MDTEKVRSIRVNFLLDSEKHKDLMLLARISNVTATDIITQLLDKFLQNNTDLLNEYKSKEVKLIL